MEKISRILPPSARTKSYDISRAQPVRPGAPDAGRPVFEPVVDKMILSEALTSSMQDNFLNGDTQIKAEVQAQYPKPKESVKSEMIRNMTEKFFLKQQDPKDLAKDTNQTISEEVVERVNRSTESNVSPESSKELSR